MNIEEIKAELKRDTTGTGFFVPRTKALLHAIEHLDKDSKKMTIIGGCSLPTLQAESAQETLKRIEEEFNR